MIADITGLVTAAGVFVTALTGWHNGRKIGAASGRVEDVHAIVNSQHDELVQKLEDVTTQRNHLDPEKPNGP
jgi:hypothetical protein